MALYTLQLVRDDDGPPEVQVEGCVGSGPDVRTALKMLCHSLDRNERGVGRRAEEPMP